MVRLLARHGANTSTAALVCRDSERAGPQMVELGRWLLAVRGFWPLHWACEARSPARVRALLRTDGTDPRCVARGAGLGSYMCTQHFSLHKNTNKMCSH